MKEEQKQHLIDMMQKDEELGLYEYIGECKGNDGNGCFMDSSGHDCGCYTRSIKQETEHLLSTKANKEIKLEDIFNDEKRQGVKDLIDTHKQRLEKYSERVDNDKSEIGNPETWGKRVVKEPKQERSYSEEEVIKLLIYCKDRFGGSGLEDYTHDDEVKEWFEKFKNK